MAKPCSGMFSTLSICPEKVKSLEKACLYMTIPAVMPREGVLKPLMKRNLCKNH